MLEQIYCGGTTSPSFFEVLGGSIGTSGNLANHDFNDIRENKDITIVMLKTNDINIQNAPSGCGNGVLMSFCCSTGLGGGTYQVFFGDSGFAERGYNTSVLGWNDWKKVNLT